MELLTVQEAARELRVSPVTVRRYIKAGRLRCIRLGRMVRVARAELDALSQAGGYESGPEGFDAALLDQVISSGESGRRRAFEGKADELAAYFEQKQARDRWIVDAALAGQKLDYERL